MSSTTDLPQPSSSAAAERPEGTFRFVVTGNNAQKRSYFVRDEFVPVGSTDQTPTLFETSPDQLARFLGMGGPGDTQEILPPYPVLPSGLGAHETEQAGGVRLGYFQLPETVDWFFEQGAPIERVEGEAGWKYGFHRHRTIDYIVISQGEYWLYLEEGEVRLRPGDVVIQRNTNHSWQRFDYTGVCSFFATIITCHTP
jgi:hypothetical protein